MTRCISLVFCGALLLCHMDIVFGSHEQRKSLTDFGINGGVNCAVCTVVVSLSEQLSIVHNETIIQSLQRLCGFLPDPYKSPCREFASFFGKLLIESFTNSDSADTVCEKLGFCKPDTGKQACHIYPKPKTSHPFYHTLFRGMKQQRVEEMSQRVLDPAICKLPGVDKICQWLDLIFNNHDPAVDLDGDRHSVYQTLRGISWRGKDCNDNRREFHPGAKPLNMDITDDSNCNGIHGKDPSTGKSYEELFCQGSQPRGVAVLGDSISAHFHLPREWFNASEMSTRVFEPLPFAAENELDWPEFSTVTAFMNNTYTYVNPGPVDSVYMRLRNRNLCNHRDYQNIAVNGADTGNMNSSIQQSLYRSQTSDQPLIVFYALVGNDVCNRHVDTFNHMTTLEDMRKNAMATLQYLETTLPSGSSVFVVGLADGGVLYRALHDRIHPIGAVRNDVTYADFYDYFNCLEISPCLGWMNTNDTIRNLTTQHAMALSGVLKDVVDKNKNNFTNFKLYYVENPINQVIDAWVAQGGQDWELLEPVDGFHSNQHGQALTAQAIWENLEKDYPEVIGPVNPNNEKIRQLFGDQGGHL